MTTLPEISNPPQFFNSKVGCKYYSYFTGTPGAHRWEIYGWCSWGLYIAVYGVDKA